MAEAAYSISDAVTDLVELPETVPASYDPGTLTESHPSEPVSRGGLTEAEAVDLLADDAPAAQAGPIVAHHRGKGLTLEQLDQGFGEGLKLMEVVGDLSARYSAIEQAGRDMYTGSLAVAEFLNVLVPRPLASQAQTDPIGYQQAMALYEHVQNSAVQVIQYAQNLARQHAEWAQSQNPRINLEFEKRCLIDAYPKATDPGWFALFRDRITKAAEACGYHASELEAVTDHRVLKVLDLAASALERRQSGKRDGAKPSSKPTMRPGPRLVAEGGSLTMSDAMAMDFD